MITQSKLARTLKNRPGSTLVLVALTLAAFMGVTAIAADIGRFYVVASELQTSADAAALRGARMLQFSTLTTPENDVDTAVIAFVAKTNRADNQNLAVTAAAVEAGFWNPGTSSVPGTFTYPSAVRPNAVRVRVADDDNTRGTFAQMIGRAAGIRLERSAIAWIGNVSLDCARPWALQYLPLVTKVNGNSDTTKALDPTKFIQYQNTSVANRTFVMRFELAGNTPISDGSWSAYNLPSQGGGGASSGLTMYEQQVVGCNNIAINSDAGDGNYQPSNGNGPCGDGLLVCSANTMIDGESGGNVRGDGICAPFAANDATCYDRTTGLPGVTIDVAFANVKAKGAGGIDFKYVGEMKLMCYFNSRPNLTCNSIPLPRAQTGYPPGTLVGITSGLKSRRLNPTDLVSNAASNVQNLYLVK